MFSGAVSYCIAPDSVQLYQLFRSKESCLIYFMLIKETGNIFYPYVLQESKTYHSVEVVE